MLPTKIVSEQIDSFDQLLSHCHLFVGLKASKVDVNVGEGKKFHNLQQRGELKEMCHFKIPQLTRKGVLTVYLCCV